MSSTSMSVRSPASFPFPTAAGARGRVGSAQPVGPKLLSSPLPPAATPAVPRRLLFPVAAGIWTSFPVAEQAARLPRRSPSGEACSSSGRCGRGDVAGSVAEFDRAIELDQRQKQYFIVCQQCTTGCNFALFQISGKGGFHSTSWTEGAEQFRLDVAANPNDTEESIWCFLCEAQLYGVDEARKRFLEAKTSMPQVGLDSRSVMRKAYALFKDGGDAEKLASNFSSGSEGEIFYSSLYTLDFTMNLRSGDYMASLALVHCECRNWTLE
uniref:Uncharacterized protein n=1 Tax=Oryza glumipatula TaxID=40148 RepID=A0A0D9Y7Z9_9ORYZ